MMAKNYPRNLYLTLMEAMKAGKSFKLIKELIYKKGFDAIN